MKEIIERVLERFGDQTNLGSKAARERISSEIEAVLAGGTSEEENDWICEHCGKDTSTVEYDYIGNGTNHLQCDLSYAREAEECSTQHAGLYPWHKKEETKHFADGFHDGRWEDDVSVLSEQIIDNVSGQYEMFPELQKYIYESPDGGKTIYKRPFGDYKNKNRVKLSKEEWENEKNRMV